MKRIMLTGNQVFRGELILVNADHAYRGNTRRKRVDMGGTALAEVAADALCAAMEKLGGWEKIAAVSGWRSFKEQQEIWDESMRENGEAFTKKYVAVPGHSEHQTGLAIDLGLRKEEIDFIRPDFPYEGICQTFRENAAKYGFVERYPAGKENVTGIGHEPWHFRYVGAVHASLMQKEALVMEEYVPYLKRFIHGETPRKMELDGREVLVSFQKAEAFGPTEIEVDERAEVSVSGNNVDGFVVVQYIRCGMTRDRAISKLKVV